MASALAPFVDMIPAPSSFPPFSFQVQGRAHFAKKKKKFKISVLSSNNFSLVLGESCNQTSCLFVFELVWLRTICDSCLLWCLHYTLQGRETSKADPTSIKFSNRVAHVRAESRQRSKMCAPNPTKKSIDLFCLYVNTTLNTSKKKLKIPKTILE